MFLSKRSQLILLALKAVIFLDGSGNDVKEAYEDVHNDNTLTTWATFEYDGKQIYHSDSGTDYDEMLDHMQDDNRVYAYARFETAYGKPMFAFITWIGDSVSPFKKAKVSTDKAFVKNICSDFTKEILAEKHYEVEYGTVLRALEAGK